MKRIFFLSMVVVILFYLWYFGGEMNITLFKEKLSFVKKEEVAVVARVIDGDTVDLSDGRRVRYVGIDTPEIGQGGKEGECFGEEAKEKNRELVEGKEIHLVRDVSEKDAYGRWLYLVFLEEISVEEILMREGYAKKMIIHPDTSLASEITKWEREAREKKVGVWRCK